MPYKLTNTHGVFNRELLVKHVNLYTNMLKWKCGLFGYGIGLDRCNIDISIDKV